MRKLLFIIPFILLYSCTENQIESINSTKKHIKVLINGTQIDWRISPEINPDRLKVYCINGKNEVVFQTDTDTISFTVSENDTVRFKIILNSIDTAYTENVGIKELPAVITDACSNCGGLTRKYHATYHLLDIIDLRHRYNNLTIKWTLGIL